MVGAPPPALQSASEEALSYEAALRLALSDLSVDANSSEVARVVQTRLSESMTQGRPLLRAMHDTVLAAVSGTDSDEDEETCAVSRAVRALDNFVSVSVVGARAKVSAFFDQMILRTGWFRIAVVAGSSVAEAAFLAVNHPKKILTVIDLPPTLPGRTLAHKLGWQTEVVVRYAPLVAAHRALEGVDVVVMGAQEVLMNGAVVVAPGGAVVVQAAQEAGVPVVIAAQAAKFSERAVVEWFDDGDVVRAREVQRLVTELDTGAWRTEFAPDVLKKREHSGGLVMMVNN